MERRAFGNTGIDVPVIGLGTSRVFAVGRSEDELSPLAEVLRILSREGGSVVDPSPRYGRAEGVTGELATRAGLSGRLFLATKVWTEGRDKGIAQMKESFRLLGTERFCSAQVYYSLGKLADQGLIRPARGAGAESRRERRTWRITPQGRRALTTALSSPHWAAQRVVPPFMTWVALCELARPAARRRILDDRRRFLEAELARERETLAGMRRLPPDAEGAQVAILMVDHAMRQMTLELEMLERLGELFGD